MTVMLFIFGYFIGKANERTENNAKLRLTEEIKIENEEGFSYLDLTKNYSESAYSTDQHAVEGKPMDETTDVDPYADFDPNSKREVNILADFYTLEQINAAKDVTRLFIQNFHSFNGDQPSQHIDLASLYVTEELRNSITGKIIRPISNFYSRNIIKLDIYEPYNPSGEDMILNARVEGEIFNSKGELVKKEIVDYEIKIIWIDNAFKVSNYTYTTLNRGDVINAE